MSFQLKSNQAKLYEGIKKQIEKEKSRGVKIYAYPRFGKTALTTQILLDYIEEHKSVLIISYQVSTLESWRESLIKYGVFKKYDFRFSTYHGLNIAARTGKKYDVVVIDEAHHITDRSFKLINKIMKEDTFIIVLTATPPSIIREEDSKKIDYLNRLVPHEAFVANLEEGIKSKSILKFRIVELVFDITSEEMYRYNTLTKEVKEAMRSNNKNRQKMAAINRMKALHKFESRIKIAKKIIEKLTNEGKRFIVFTSYSDIADKLGNSIHSKVPKKLRDKRLKDFKLGRINYITSINMLREGIDLPNVDEVLFVSYNSDYKDAIQKLGRSLNPGVNDINKEIPVVFLIARYTKDKQWFNMAVGDVTYIVDVVRCFARIDEEDNLKVKCNNNGTKDKS